MSFRKTEVSCQGGGYLRQRHDDHCRSVRRRQEVMALHPGFPASPYSILDPTVRWFPADEALRENSMDKLMPPLVPELRRKVKEWRESGYTGAAETSKSLLDWWF